MTAKPSTPGSAAPTAADEKHAVAPVGKPDAPATRPTLMDKLRVTPLPLFATVMGTGGLSMAWRRAHETLGTPSFIADALFWFAAAVYVALLVAYGVRISNRERLLEDLRHPMKITFLTAITVSLVILATAGRPVLPGALVDGMWWVGAVGHLAGMLLTMRMWINPRITLDHVTAAWFIPVVGNVLVPLAGVPLGHPRMSAFSFSIGIIMWLGILPIVLLRLFVHKSMPPKFLPTVLILVAPPAVGSVSALTLFGDLDNPSLVGGALLSTAGAFLMLALTMLPEITKLPFNIPHWAMSFPLAAMAAATLLFSDAVGILFLAVSSILIAWLWGMTIAAIAKGGIFVKE